MAVDQEQLYEPVEILIFETSVSGVLDSSPNPGGNEGIGYENW